MFLEVWPIFESWVNTRGLKLRKALEALREDMGKLLLRRETQKSSINRCTRWECEKGDHIICDCKVKVEEVSF